MQAVRIHQNGEPSVLQVEDLPIPKPGAGQVLVRVLAASVNHLDLWVRRGIPGLKLPLILGCDGTGEIAELGAGVTGLKVGQKVVLEPGFSSGDSEFDRAGLDHLSDDYGIRGEHSDGFDCEFVVLDARFVFPLPAGLDPIVGAAAPLTFVTAWGMLVTRTQLKRGETVLVLGGTSGVGQAAIQIANDLGARVIATSSAEAKRKATKDLGAHEVVDHSQPDWDKAVKKLTDGRGVDVVFEHVGPATWDLAMRCLARRGRLVTCGGTTGPKVSILLPHLFMKNLSVLGATMGPKNALPGIFDKLASGKYKLAVDRVLPMSEVRKAHELLEARQVTGKIVLVPGK
ncbi:MAG: zinc-binding dehydrogenase [Planctomycetes bacterium]|nr:zinc-binding dehydrogenase [Planctomycetota bacterium]